MKAPAPQLASTLLALHVTPKASADTVVGWHGAALKVKVRAAPENGRANAAVCDLLARVFDLPRRAVTLEAGAASRQKRVRLAGLTSAAIPIRMAARSDR